MKKYIAILSFVFVFLMVSAVQAEETEAPSHRITDFNEVGSEMPYQMEDGEMVNPTLMAPGARAIQAAPRGVSPVRIGGAEPGRVLRVSPLVSADDRIFGDLNGDGYVDFNDLKIIIDSFGPCSSLTSGCPADLNNDRTVNSLDVLLLLNNFTRYTDELPSIVSSLQRCQNITSNNAQRKCLAVAGQESEIELRAKEVSPALIQRIGIAETDGENIQVGIEMRARAYLKYWDNMMTRMTAAISRLNSLAERIESRIEKLEEEGADLSQAKTQLVEAKRLIESATAEQNAIAGSYGEILKGENLTEEFAKLREMVGNLRELIMDAHQALVEVVSNIKAGLN